MLPLSRLVRFDRAVIKVIVFRLTILPVMLLAATCAWADEVQPNKLASDNTDGSAPPSIRHIDVSDPPPFVIKHNPAVQEADGPLGIGGCPEFLFRNGFESGKLTQAGGDGTEIQYITSGGYLLQIDLHTIEIQDPISRNKVEHWGDPHENLNGKHMKDWAGAAGWDGTRRTIMLGDGTKVTMESTGAQGVVDLTSIYDGEQNVQIGNAANTVLHHSVDPADSTALDFAQHDGETSQFTTNTITGIASYITIYNEDSNFLIVPFNVQLGVTGGCANPNSVNDFFDDPRLGHT
jgi:hypothetical protein